MNNVNFKFHCLFKNFFLNEINSNRGHRFKAPSPPKKIKSKSSFTFYILHFTFYSIERTFFMWLNRNKNKQREDTFKKTPKIAIDDVDIDLYKL